MAYPPLLKYLGGGEGNATDRDGGAVEDSVVAMELLALAQARHAQGGRHGPFAWSSDSGPTSACGVRTPMRTVASQPSRLHLLRFSCSDMRGSSFLPVKPRTISGLQCG